MAPAYGYPSGSNTFVPDHEASQSLVVGYSRNPRTFKVSSYVQYVSAKRNLGLYAKWESRQAARILTPDDAEHLWEDGDPVPPQYPNLGRIAWLPFKTQRRAFAFTIGYLAADQASFPLVAAEAGDHAQQAMTSRTLRTYNALKTADWGTENTADVDGGILSPAGHNWKTGSTGVGGEQGPNIKLSLQYADRKIHLQTIGVVQPAQLSLVVNPTTAQGMSASAEIQDYIKQSPYSLDQLMGDIDRQTGQWGLPEMLYGHPVVVEDAVRVTSRAGASPDALSYILPDGEAYLLAREGELDGMEGMRSFSTVQMFYHLDEMTVETFDDVNNRRYQGRVVTNDSIVVPSTISGFRFTKCLG
jgi:hypothetical protein